MGITTSAWPINENGELVIEGGTGSNNVTGWVNQDQIPVTSDGKIKIAKMAQLATGAGGNVVGFVGPTCFRDNTQRISTLTGSDEVVLTLSIPAAVLRADSLIRITSLWSCTNSANAKSFKIQADGQSVLSLSQTTVASFHDMHIIRFRSMSSQVTNNSATATPFGTTSSTGVTTLTVDATDGVTLTFIINRSNAGDAAALEAAIVEVF